MKLISGWRRSWRLFSVQALAALALIPLLWEQCPPEVQAVIPEGWRPWVIFLVALGGIAGRLVDQGGGE